MLTWGNRKHSERIKPAGLFLTGHESLWDFLMNVTACGSSIHQRIRSSPQCVMIFIPQPLSFSNIWFPHCWTVIHRGKKCLQEEREREKWYMYLFMMGGKILRFRDFMDHQMLTVPVPLRSLKREKGECHVVIGQRLHFPEGNTNYKHSRRRLHLPPHTHTHEHVHLPRSCNQRHLFSITNTLSNSFYTVFVYSSSDFVYILDFVYPHSLFWTVRLIDRADSVCRLLWIVVFSPKPPYLHLLPSAPPLRDSERQNPTLTHSTITHILHSLVSMTTLQVPCSRKS